MVIKMHGGMDMKKKWLAALLSAAMLVTASPVAAMAQTLPDSSAETVVGAASSDSSAGQTAQASGAAAEDNGAGTGAEAAGDNAAGTSSQAVGNDTAGSNSQAAGANVAGTGAQTGSGTAGAETSDNSVASSGHAGEVASAGEESTTDSTAASSEAQTVGDVENASISVAVSDNEDTAEVTVTDPEATDGKLILAIWSMVNGQDDIQWINTVKQADGTYTAEVDLTDFDGYGTFACHAYLQTASGAMEFQTYTNFEVPEPEKGVKAELSSNTTTISASATGVSPNASKVLFAVWSDANGQDDITWESANKAGNGVWYDEDIRVNGHKNAGLYHIHCYQYINGAASFIGATELNVPGATATATIENINNETGEFTVRVSGINSPSGVSSILVPIWGDVNQQNDIIWETPVKSGNDYIVKTSVAKHLYETGTYFAHVYITDGNGIQSCAAQTSADITFSDTNALTATVSSDQKTVTVSYRGIRAINGEALKAAVWSADNAQDDIRWYDMTTKDGIASVTFPISNHKSAGKYYVHLYSGTTTFVTDTTFNVTPVTASGLTVSSINGNAGTFHLTLSGVSAPAGISDVKIAVWPTGDQSKMHWYTPKQTSAGTYEADASVAHHGNAFGDYTEHAYVWGANGILCLVAHTTSSIAASGYVYATPTSATTCTVTVVNPGSNVASVLFPTWSATNAQDDIVWYTATKTGANTWSANVNSKNHKHSGMYYTHCYATNTAGVQSFVGYTTYNLQYVSANHNQDMYNRAQGQTSKTGYLIMVDRSIHRVGIYTGSQNNWTEVKYWPCVVGKPSTPTPTGRFEIGTRFDWFGDGHKCWWATQISGYYYFHSVIYYWDSAPRKILDGTMDAAASHGCVRLDEPNARWIYTTIPRHTTVVIYN